MISTVRHRHEQSKAQHMKQPQAETVHSTFPRYIEEIWKEGNELFDLEKVNYKEGITKLHSFYQRFAYKDYIDLLENLVEADIETSKSPYKVLHRESEGEEFQFAFRSKDTLKIILRLKNGKYFSLLFELKNKKGKLGEIVGENFPKLNDLSNEMEKWMFMPLEAMAELNELKKICLQSSVLHDKESLISIFFKNLNFKMPKTKIDLELRDIFDNFILKEALQHTTESFTENIIQNLFACHLQAFIPNDIPFMSEINLEILSHGHFILNSPFHERHLAMREKTFEGAKIYFLESENQDIFDERSFPFM